jgi:hypothetical protein
MRPLYDCICQLASCRKPFQSKNKFAVGCTKAHALEHNRQTITIRGGGRKKLTVGVRHVKAGYAGAVEVTNIIPRRRNAFL